MLSPPRPKPLRHLELVTPIASLPGMGTRLIAKLRVLGIHTVQELLWHFPSRYEDFREVALIRELEPGMHTTVQARVRTITLKRSWQRRWPIVEAVLSDESGEVKAVWFNQPYVRNTLRPGRLVNCSGKVAVSDEREIYLSHPAYEVLDRTATENSEAETTHTARLVPIYPETRGLTSRGLRSLIQLLFETIGRLPEWVPNEVLEDNYLPEINQALRSVHFPEQAEEALLAKRRFAFEALLLLQLSHLKERLRLASKQAPAIAADLGRVKELIARLPFKLTLSQKKALWEILQDINKPHPMNRLLQGDVGSGKTVVAALAAIVAKERGYQTALMAPTEVLARQHFETFKKLFSRFDTPDLTLGLLTASGARLVHADQEAARPKPELITRIARGEVGIVLGTHALIEKWVRFPRLGLVVIDEQHRFGVAQRARLTTSHATPPLVPHFLSMSATPIPRTLMLTALGDLDISLITELPAGRKRILTKIVAPEHRRRAYEFIREQIGKGRQAFVICPRIESSTNGDPKRRMNEFQKLEMKSVKEEFERLSKNVFPDLTVGLLHGQLRAREKEEVMRKFRDGKTSLLVSTSVVEVGVDVPNATIMMIEGAERFGLAQLYQFRGRVGRGSHQSFCFLFTDSDARGARERLKAITQAKNGLELAERDLALRGPGEFLGTKQTGLPDQAMHGLQDRELILKTRGAAVKLVEADAALGNHPLLQAKLEEFEHRIHLE